MENEEEQSPQRTGLDSCLLAVLVSILIGIMVVGGIILDIQQQLTMGA